MCAFQPKKYSDVIDLIADLPATEKDITSMLLDIIGENLIFKHEKLAYNVPYFYGNTRICFVWPASIPWGNTKPNSVQLGFCNGALFAPELKGKLLFEDRKTVGVLRFSDSSEIDTELIKLLLFEAQQIDALKPQKKPNQNS